MSVSQRRLDICKCARYRHSAIISALTDTDVLNLPPGHNSISPWPSTSQHPTVGRRFISVHAVNVLTSVQLKGFFSVAAHMTDWIGLCVRLYVCANVCIGIWSV